MFMNHRSLFCSLFLGTLTSLSACGGDSDQSAAVSQPSAAEAPAAKASGKKGEGKRKGKGKISIPRVEGSQIRVTTRVVPDVSAQGRDKSGSQKACRIQFVVGTDGIPASIVSVECEEAYVDSVIQAAQSWRFAQADGSAFESKVRIVREIQFTLK